MSLNTIEINRLMDRFDSHASVWLFGYGSLIFKADFPYLERRPASIAGWSRRFYQGSHDHRGTQDAPGRVVTLVPEEGALCHGMAYLVTPEEFAHLDHREKNGYLRLATEMTFDDGGTAEGIVYIATHENAAWLGPASERDIACQIAGAHGPTVRTASTCSSWRGRCAHSASAIRMCRRSKSICLNSCKTENDNSQKNFSDFLFQQAWQIV